MKQQIVAECKFFRWGKHNALLSLLDDTRLDRLNLPNAVIKTVTSVHIPLITVYNFDALHQWMININDDAEWLKDIILYNDKSESLYKDLLKVIMNKDKYPDLLPHLNPFKNPFNVINYNSDSYFYNAKKVCDVMYEIGMNGEWSQKDGWRIIYKAEIEW